ncbi:MAG: cytochrome c oxidase assembly protein [Gaiellaceae bacterium]
MNFSLEAVGFVPALAVAGLAMHARRVPLVAGLALVFAAFFTKLQPLAIHTFLWAHLLQNVVLAEWAPALLVLAVPPAVAKRARAFPPFQPFVALPIWLGTYFVWHLPWIYDFALRHPHSLLHVEHATYLLAGICVWWPVVHGRFSAGIKAAYLFAAFVLASPLGLVLALFPRPIYSFYEHAPRTWGPSPETDQRLAGVTMAAEQALVIFAVFTHFLLRFLREEQGAGAFDELRATRRSASPPASSGQPGATSR